MCCTVETLESLNRSIGRTDRGSFADCVACARRNFNAIQRQCAAIVAQLPTGSYEPREAVLARDQECPQPMNSTYQRNCLKHKYGTKWSDTGRAYIEHG